MSLRKTIGIDIGGTKMAVGAVMENRILARRTVPTEPARGFPQAMGRLKQAVAAAIQEAGWDGQPLDGIGIGCAGPVDPVTARICNPYTLPGWDGYDLRQPLAEHFHVPVHVENDADVAAVGEFHAGAGRGASHLVLLTVGTGIGGAVLVNGAIYRGTRNEHPEFGHIPISDSPDCYCGRSGCLEAIASGTALQQAAVDAGFDGGRELLAAARAGDRAARGIVGRAVDAMAAAVWTFLHTFLPDRIVLGGGLMEEHFDLFAPALRETVRRATLIPAGRVEVRAAALGNEAGVIGAARIAASSGPRIG